MDGGLFAPPFFLTTDGGPSFPNGFNFPLALGDFDDDGQLDIAVGQLALGEVAVFFGNGDGSFSSAVEYTSAFGIPANVLSLTEGARTHLVVVDLATPSNDEGQVTVVDLQRDGGLSVIATVPLITNDFGDGNASIADLNGDGYPDLLVGAEATGQGRAINVFLASADGGWLANGFVPDWAYHNDFVGDFNEDGFPDVVAQSASPSLEHCPLELFLGNGDGTFDDHGLFGAIEDAGVASVYLIGDLNEDGHLDLLVDYGWYSLTDTWMVLLGQGDGTFVQGPAVSLGVGRPSALRDLDGDGHLDYIGAVAPYGSADIHVALGNGDGTFQPPMVLTTSGGVGGIVIGDVNNDGRPDLIATDEYSQVVSVYINCR
jgi:hypothetical protein